MIIRNFLYLTTSLSFLQITVCLININLKFGPEFMNPKNVIKHFPEKLNITIDNIPIMEYYQKTEKNNMRNRMFNLIS